MIERYSLPEMDAIFSDVARFSRYLDIELHALDGQAKDEIYLKDYSESARIAKYAIGLGFLEPSDTGLDMVSGFREFRRYRIIG